MSDNWKKLQKEVIDKDKRLNEILKHIKKHFKLLTILNK